MSPFFFVQLRKVERDKKTMEQEIVDLTNKLLDAKNTINRLEELNVSPTDQARRRGQSRGCHG